MIASCIENLGIAYKGQGHIEEAESQFYKALKMNESLFGEKHPDVVVSLGNLAACYDSQGKYIQAKDILLKSIEISKEHELPNTSVSLNNLAKIYKALKEYSKSEKFLLMLLK